MHTVRIGLIRHFEVAKPMPRGWMTSGHLQAWLEEYDATDVISTPVDLGGIPWVHCLSSDLKRAHITAQAVFPTGPVTPQPQLREATILPFRTGNLSLPFWLWRTLIRLAWLTAHESQRPARDEFMQRMRAVSEDLAARDQDTLVVCHAGMMYFLRKELLRRGFTGPKFKLAQNARLYVFEKKAAAGATTP